MLWHKDFYEHIFAVQAYEEIFPEDKIEERSPKKILEMSSVIRKSIDSKMEKGRGPSQRLLPSSAGNAEALGVAGSRGRAAPEAETFCYSKCLALRDPEVPDRAPP